MNRILFSLVSSLLFASISACGANLRPPDALDTDPKFHRVALAPQNFIIPYPSYLIALEKADRDHVGRPTYQGCITGEAYCFNTKAPYFKAHEDKGGSLYWDIRKRFREPRSHFVSHIVRYDANAGAASKARFIYNIYSDDTALNGQQARAAGITDYVRQSWDVLTGRFAKDLKQRVLDENVTHIIVYSTGWNTQQAESIENYQDWFGTLVQAYEEYRQHCSSGQTRTHSHNQRCPGQRVEAFRPLFIGLSWSSDWPDLPGPIDYQNKAHDADEIGLTWGNVLINKVLKPVKQEQGTQLVAIGHSFGARLLSRSLHSSPLIIEEHDDAENNPPIDLFIGLQGAFSYKRFVEGEGEEGSPYHNYPLRAEKFLFTTSKYDTAVDTAPVSLIGASSFIGDEATYEEVLRAQQSGEMPVLFEFIRLDSDGHWVHAPSADSMLITLIDASEVISVNKPGSGGNAHSDVYDLEIARFILDSIIRYASADYKF